jgi:putative Mg2+ transporter-C (MgtC) family protein
MIDSLDQAFSGWAHGMGWSFEALLRLLLAAFCGGLVGLEREIHGRQAGFRTHLLVGLGSALVMVVSVSMALQEWPSPGKPGVQVSIDPGRIAYGVMAGIGFLGAGTIIHNKGSIRGLTTAAALWSVAAIGMAAGAGLYFVTLAAAMLTVTVLWVLHGLESMIPQRRFRYITVRVPWRPDCLEQTVNYLKERGFHLSDISMERVDNEFAQIQVLLSFSSRKDFVPVATMIANDPNFELIATREMQS